MSFRERLGTIQVSAGVRAGNGHGVNYYDKEAVEGAFGSPSEQEDIREETDGIGTLKWRSGEPYKFNRKDKEYERASSTDLDKVLYGPKKGRSVERVTIGGDSGGSR